MHFEIRQNIPAYLADLNHWVAETRDDPLEEMSNFFTERVSTYEEQVPGALERGLSIHGGAHPRQLRLPA